MHTDDGFHPDPLRKRSLMTCMLYLNGRSGGSSRKGGKGGGGRKGFGGGRTRFFDLETEKQVFAFSPRAGSCLVFKQGMLHDGEPLSHGMKFMVRTDVYFSRMEP